jgi:NADPH2:quinone reductase
MENQTQKALVVQALGSVPVFADFEIPQPAANEVLIKVAASTINPSDRFRVRGAYGATKVPFVAGLEGCGEIVKAGSP